MHGKATAILSPNREFIFGDGFYHNLTSPSRPQNSPEILAPLTPRLAVLYARPMQYTTEPRLSTLVIGVDETETLNHVVQIYARVNIFYRSENGRASCRERGCQYVLICVDAVSIKKK